VAVVANPLYWKKLKLSCLAENYTNEVANSCIQSRYRTLESHVRNVSKNAHRLLLVAYKM
jgi:hypothetical protein